MDTIELLQKLSDASIPLLALLVLYGGWKKYWVWGYVLEDVRKEKDAQIAYERAEKEQWKQLMLEARELTNRSVAVATSAVRQAGQ